MEASGKMTSSPGIRALVIAALVATILAISSGTVSFVYYDGVTTGAQLDEVALASYGSSEERWWRR